jgi:hypothetical protein
MAGLELRDRVVMPAVTERVELTPLGHVTARDRIPLGGESRFKTLSRLLYEYIHFMAPWVEIY